MAIYDVNGNTIDASGIFVNVKSNGAKGDGTTDDAGAIQDALDAIQNTGGTVFFPVGTYLIKTALIFYSNQTLFFDNGATILQGDDMDNLMRAYAVNTWGGYDGTHDCRIIGATFDGGAYEENNALLATVHAKNIVIENCTFKNAYGSWHDLEINSSYNVKIINCDFEGARKTGTGELIQIDYAGNSTVYPWTAKYDSTVCKYVEIRGCFFHDAPVTAIGNHSSAAHKYISIHDNVFDGLTSTDGAIKFVANMHDVDIFDNYFTSCAKGVGYSDGASYYIRGNRFSDCTTAISGSGIAHGNMINGTYTA